MLKHIALEANDRREADIFFTEILGLKKTNSLTISAGLNKAVFGIEKEMAVENFEREGLRLEVFITGRKKIDLSCDHVCIEVENKEEFIKKCEKHDIKTNIVKKEGKDLLFARDFSGNLFEIKEKRG